MENNTTAPTSLHPVLWIAGIAVTLLSLVGIASLTGLLPAKSAPPPPQPPVVAAAAVPPPAPVTAPAATAAPPVAAVPAAMQPAVAATRHKTAKRKMEPDNAPGPIAALPPPAGAGVPPDYVPPPTAATALPVAPPCHNCGVIADIRQITHEGQGTGLGAIAGGVFGGALGNNVGGGSGRTLATIAGAVGGGLLGNTIEKSQRQTVSYQISVRMEDGTTQILDAGSMPSWRIGDQVKLINGGIVSR